MESGLSDLSGFEEFLARLELLIARNPDLITTTLSNIFSMRLIGNKAHGDLGEIAVAEFVNQFMYDYEAQHVGKDLFRAKSFEEDIVVTSRVSKLSTPISLKAYGDGPLQLSTDKESAMYPFLESFGSEEIRGADLQTVFEHPSFAHFSDVNVLPLIYREKDMQCNILVFSSEQARSSTNRIVKLSDSAGRGRKHPVWRFEDSDGAYICEVRYGNASANALQRGLWTHTRNAVDYFHSVTGGWISYSHNMVLIELFAKALNSSPQGHENALSQLELDLARIREDQRIG